MTTTEKLDRLHELRLKVDLLELQRKENYKRVLGDDLFKAVQDTDEMIEAQKRDIQDEAIKLESEIKSIVEREKRTFVGNFIQAVWSRGKMLFNRDLLEHEMKKDRQFAKKMKAFYEEGKPSVSFRAVGKK